MATVNLNNGAEQILQIAGLPGEQEQTVITCIVNYGNPRGNCLDAIVWIAYRIWNAVKALFGMSDWQIAMANVKSSLHENFFEREVRSENVERALDCTIDRIASIILDKTLNHHLTGTNASIANVLMELGQGLQQYGQRVQQTLQAPEETAPAPPSTPLQPPQSSQPIENSEPPPPSLPPVAIELPTPENDPMAAVVDATPAFNDYNIGKDSLYDRYKNMPLSDIPLRPANLFFQALHAETTMPGTQGHFRFLHPERVREEIFNADPNVVVQFSANEVRVNLPEREPDDISLLLLERVYGENTYRISYGELQNTLRSQKIYCSPILPKEFYVAFKQALLADEDIILPGWGCSRLLEYLDGEHCQQLLCAAKENPNQYGFASGEEAAAFLKFSLFQVGAMVVKTEDFLVFADVDGQILERHPGEKDVLRLISACGITGGLNRREWNSNIMCNTFRTVLKAAEGGLLVIPAVGLDVVVEEIVTRDPGMYWNAFFDAVAKGADHLEKIYVNPRHSEAEGRYANRDGDEFAEILDQQIARLASADQIAYFSISCGEVRAREVSLAMIKNLKKIVNLYDKKTDLLQLAYNLKKANPDKNVSLLNESTKDVTLGNNVGNEVNRLGDYPPTTEEHFSMISTHCLCFEQITGVHQDPERIIQPRLDEYRDAFQTHRMPNRYTALGQVV